MPQVKFSQGSSAGKEKKGSFPDLSDLVKEILLNGSEGSFTL